MNDMPYSISRVIETVQPYAVNARQKRPAYHKTLPDNLEIEAKIHITSDEDVIGIMEKLKPLGLTGFEYRSEEQYMFRLDDGAHICRIVVQGQKEEWLKLKSKNTRLTTPKYKFPAVLRSGSKLKVGDDDYKDAYKLTKELPLMTVFNKECLNFFYPYRQCIFSLSFSLAWNDTFLRREMEFEYEGHTDQRTPPTRQEIEEIFEDMFVELIGEPFTNRIHAETKYEALSI